MSIEEAQETDKDGHPVIRKTTKGWDLYVTWKDGSNNWVSLKDINNLILSK